MNDGEGAYIQVASIGLKTGVEYHGDQAFSGLHDEGRDSQGCNAADDPGAGTEVAPTDAQAAAPAAQKAEDPAGAHRLRENSGQSGTLDAPAQQEDKDGVQDDVEECADQDAEHGHQSLSLGADEGVQAQGQLDEYRPKQIDPDIVHTIGDSGIGGAEGV